MSRHALQRKFSRRAVLRGFGAAVALPLLETFSFPTVARGAAKAELPRRLMFVYVPNGAVMNQWTPSEVGAEYELPATLQPLTPYRHNLNVISGLSHKHGEANGDGPGDHARASASYLTGAQPRKTASVDIRAGVSVDQIAAGHAGKLTRFPSLELACDKGRQAGSCDSGYSCVYQFSMSWKTPTLPLPPEVDARRVFNRMFATGRDVEDAAAVQQRREQRRSVLDFVQEDARRLRKELSGQDVPKLDQYLDSVREIEQRLDRSADERAKLPPGVDPIDGIPANYTAHVRMMYDLSVLAFRTDATRVISLMIAHDGSNRSYPMVDVPDGHHDLSHHGNNKDKLAKIARIDRFHVEQFAYFLDKIRDIEEGEGSLLDQCLITYGSGLADGNAHQHRNLPLILAGRGGGSVAPGQHLKYEVGTPMCNLYVAMLQRLGMKIDRFGDSTGALDRLS